MDAARRQVLAATAAGLVGELERAVVDSWKDLIPSAASWTVAERGHARDTVREVLEGIVGVIAQGDLDDQWWRRLREALSASTAMDPEEAQTLVRSVRVPGVELLLHRLDERHRLSGDERWTLQVQTGWFCDQLTQERDDFDPRALQRLLADLEGDGPDIA